MARSGGHPLLWIGGLGVGAYVLLRYGLPATVAPPVAAPGATPGLAPTVTPAVGAIPPDGTWTAEPTSLIPILQAATNITNPFDALVVGDPTGAVREEYYAWLNRAPDPAGQAYWVNWIGQQEAAGVSPYLIGPELIQQFQNSPEAKALHA